jgi:hypothetical protein
MSGIKIVLVLSMLLMVGALVLEIYMEIINPRPVRIFICFGFAVGIVWQWILLRSRSK